MHLFSTKANQILLYSNGLVKIATAMFGPLYALFVEQIGGNLFHASLAIFIFAFSAGITTLLAHRYTEKIKDNELVLVWGYLLLGFGFLGYVFVNSITTLFLVQAIIGIAEAVYSPVFDKLYSKHLTWGQQAVQWSHQKATYYFVAGLGAVFGGLIVILYGFDIIFLLIASLCFLSSAYIWFLPREIL